MARFEPVRQYTLPYSQNVAARPSSMEVSEDNDIVYNERSHPGECQPISPLSNYSDNGRFGRPRSQSRLPGDFHARTPSVDAPVERDAGGTERGHLSASNLAPPPTAASEDSRVTLFHHGYTTGENRHWVDEEVLSSGDETVQYNDRDEGFTERKPTVLEAAVPAGSAHEREPESKKDPNLITWTGPDDPLHPHNWPAHRRWTSTILIAMFAFIAPMASTMLAPALNKIEEDLDVETDVEKFLLFSIFLLAFAIGPFFWGPLSEVYGRVSVMKGANIIFLIFNTACGFARTKQQMMAFRFCSGIGGSAPQAIGGGINHDCFRKENRGKAVALYSLMPFLSPAIAPIMGGYLAQYVNWRWVFFATSIFDLLVQVACFFLLRETHHPTILRNKAKALRKYTGNKDLHIEHEGPGNSMKHILMKSLVRPFIMLTTQPALQAMSLFRGFQYGIMYLVFATFGIVFEDIYDQEVDRASLNYLSLGVGFFIGLQISGTLQDRVYKWCKKHRIDPRSGRSTWRAFRLARFPRGGRRQQSDPEMFKMNTEYAGPGSGGAMYMVPRQPSRTASPTPPPVPPKPGHSPPRPGHLRRAPTGAAEGIPEYRLPLIIPFSLLIPLGLFIYGWSAHFTVHWIVPNVGVAIMSIGLIVCFNCVQAYTVDTYTTYSASATGAAAFIRTMCGFSFPLFAPKMYDSLGIGWGNSLLGFVALTFGMVAPCMLWKYGIWLRKRSTYCTE